MHSPDVSGVSIEPMPAGSRVRLSAAYDGWLGRLIGRATASINRDYLALEAAGLKRRVEST